MTIESDKQNKTCPYCYKEVKNLGLHIINNHPTIINKLEEEENQSPAEYSKQIPEKPNLVRTTPQGDISSMIKEKLETMLNIKLIQMLEKGASIEDINRIMNPPPPPQTSGLEELKKLLEMQKLITPQTPMFAGEVAEPSINWIELIKEGLPILAQMLQQRKNNNMESVNNGFNTGEFEETSARLPELISGEIAEDRRESSNIGEEPSNIIGTNESFNLSDEGINKRDI